MTRRTAGANFPGFYPEGPDFPVGSESQRFHRGDPATSKQAAKAIRSELGQRQQEALALVRRFPGSTAHELDDFCGQGDGVRIARRLSELQAAGLVRISGTKPNPDTGRACSCWWEVDEA